MTKWTTRICAIAVALLTVAPAIALPIGENTIRAECKAANGTYSTYVTYSNVTKETYRWSFCQYRDIKGAWYTDYYVNGDYYSTRP